MGDKEGRAKKRRLLKKNSGEVKWRGWERSVRWRRQKTYGKLWKAIWLLGRIIRRCYVVWWLEEDPGNQDTWVLSTDSVCGLKGSDFPSVYTSVKWD